MRIKVSRRQFQILLDNFYMVADKDLCLSMSGNTFNFLQGHE